MQKMKALICPVFGADETDFSLEEVQLPTPQKDEVRVKVHAVSLNPVDWKIPKYFHHLNFPRVVGLDVAGTIDSVGSDVIGWKEGDRVYYHHDLRLPHGGFAEYAITKAVALCRIPENVSFIDAAALPCAGWTAYVSLFKKLRVVKGKSIVITGGSGGVGGFAVQLAKLSGLTVYATCSSKNADYVRQLGADDVIDYTANNVVTSVLQRTQGWGVDYWLDTVGSESAATAFEALAFHGELACVAGVPPADAYSHSKWTLKGHSIHSVFLGQYFSARPETQKELAEIGTHMINLLAENKLNSLVSEVIALDNVPKALGKIRQSHVRGKIVAELIHDPKSSYKVTQISNK
jgi:NADPH2:quinone reductase